MKTPGGNLKPPDQPTPQGVQVPFGGTSPVMQPQTSYLPTDPTQMASGLTPEMMQAISSAPPPQVQQLAAAPVQNQQQDLRQLLAMLMSSQPTDRNRYMGGSGSHGGLRG